VTVLSAYAHRGVGQQSAPRPGRNPGWPACKKQLAERILATELMHHLKAEAKQGKSGNHRSGTSSKAAVTPNGTLKLDIPRERQAM
jgi:transposase-like protein